MVIITCPKPYSTPLVPLYSDLIHNTSPIVCKACLPLPETPRLKKEGVLSTGTDIWTLGKPAFWGSLLGFLYTHNYTSLKGRLSGVKVRSVPTETFIMVWYF